MTSLRLLDLSKNNLTGTIPACLGNLSIHLDLDLAFNHLTGSIPSSLCQLTSLRVLFLQDNNFNGKIPTCLGNISKLHYLNLGANQLEGPLPRSLANCTVLISLNVSHNRIYDTFPLWLRLSPGFAATLDLQSNKFHGSIGLFPCPLSFIDLSNNNFEGPLPVPSPTTQYYILSNNKFTGPLPSLICNANGLTIINLSNNSLSGPIPHCFMNFITNVLVLNLRANKLDGQIPSAIFVPGNRLRTIDFSQNQFVGVLPKSLAHCKNLEVLDVGNNMIEDSFPSWLETLPKLQVLVLRANRFYGHVVKSSNSSLQFPQLHIFDISRNNFSGPLPHEYIRNLKAMMDEHAAVASLQFENYSSNNYVYQDSITVTMKGFDLELVRILTVFTTIDLSGNSFQGVISEDIGNLKALTGLNFSHNHLTGSIPSSIGSLKNLEWLDLSWNKLTGEIPNTMVDMTFLAVLKLSMNQLTGPIPQGSQFDTFSSNSFEGNPGLCGTQLSKPCRSNGAKEPPPASDKEEDSEQEKWIEWRAVAMGYGSGLVIGVSVGYILLKTRRPLWLAKMVEKKIYSRRTRTRARRNGPGQHGRNNRG